MTAASTSDARKRHAAQVDPVEVVARVLHPRAFEYGREWIVLALEDSERVVAALRAEGMLP